MDVHAQRQLASQLSGGVSSGDIHAAALAAAKASGRQPDDILDFGAGIGGFIPRLRAAFPQAQVSGADIMPRPAALPPEVDWFQADLNEQLPLQGGSFDLIFSIEVIEHLENPRHFARELFRLLRPGGRAVVTTPNTGSFRSLLLLASRGHHAYFDDANYPAHITPVGWIDLLRASREAGFESCDFFYSNNGCIPKLLKWKWQNIPVVGKRLKGRLFSDNFGAVLGKPAG